MPTAATGGGDLFYKPDCTFSHVKGSNNYCGIEAWILKLYFPFAFTYYAKRKVKRGMDINVALSPCISHSHILRLSET